MLVVNNKKFFYLNEVIGIIFFEGIMIKEVVKEFFNFFIEFIFLSLKWFFYEGNIKVNMED